MMQVGIVNDLRVVGEALRMIVAATPGFHVAWVARDGASAVTQHRAHPADIVLMDLIMPGMDGVETTEAIMKARPCAVLVVTATVTGNRELVFAAMGKGALDAVNTPDATSEAAVSELRRKLVTVSRLVRSASAASHTQAGARAVPPVAASEPADEASLPVIGIGASTGGPQALATILRALPADFRASIIVVQHLDRVFVPGFRKWLQGEARLPVHLAREGEPLQQPGIWLANSEHHLIVRAVDGELRLHYTDHPLDNPHRPSVDVFFHSLAHIHGVARCGVLLTGMGSDGADGLLSLRHAGAPTWAQDQASSVVYGMPSVAWRLGAVSAPTPLDQIAGKLKEFVVAAHRLSVNPGGTL